MNYSIYKTFLHIKYLLYLLNLEQKQTRTRPFLVTKALKVIYLADNDLNDYENDNDLNGGYIRIINFKFCSRSVLCLYIKAEVHLLNFEPNFTMDSIVYCDRNER